LVWETASSEVPLLLTDHVEPTIRAVASGKQRATKKHFARDTDDRGLGRANVGGENQDMPPENKIRSLAFPAYVSTIKDFLRFFPQAVIKKWHRALGRGNDYPPSQASPVLDS
jgi:hypothetical protein